MKGRQAKHNIDIMFLMVVFLIFTFSAVSVLLMAINSYRSVVNASESTASARTAAAYMREVIHQHDEEGKIWVGTFEGNVCVTIDEGEGYYLYLYEYDGAIRELNAKEGSGATPDFGDKIIDVKSMDIATKEDGNIIEITIIDNYDNEEVVDIYLKSKAGEGA